MRLVISAGQRVGLLLENRPAFFEHWFALNALGVSVVPINPDLRAGELEYLIVAFRDDRGGRAAAAPRATSKQPRRQRTQRRDFRTGRADPGRSSVPVAAHPTLTRDTECALLYTSGTTGRPKGCVLTNTYFHNSGQWYLTVGGHMQLMPGEERMLTPLPLFHMNAMATSTMTMLMSGGCLIVLDRFHPKTWWQSVRESRATIVHYLGVMPPMLMSAPAVRG